MRACLDDVSLAQQVGPAGSQKYPYLRVIANSYTVRVTGSTTNAVPDWVDLGSGDAGEETLAILRSTARAGRLSWAAIAGRDVFAVDPSSAMFAKVGIRHINAWVRDRDKATGTAGRQGEITDRVRFEVAADAAWRCQFDGCGEDLRRHFVPGVRGNFGYFAHIVASSSNGPRGDSELSPALANDPENIMLLCDKCHRTIDRVAPLRYSRTDLEEMRGNSIAAVRRCLDTLRYPGAQMLVVGGNIEGQSFAFDEYAAEQAMWLRGTRSLRRPEWFARNGGHLGESNAPTYWLSLFQLLKSTDIPRLKSLLAGTAQGTVEELPLAVFPVHGTSVLVLSGRLIGESRSVHIFQFHRDQVSGNRGKQWAWPGGAPQPDKYRVYVHKKAIAGEAEALLQVNLTARVPASDLPDALFSDGDWVLPSIEITVDQCSHRVIGDPQDLELLGHALDDALRTLQDEWRVRLVHLVVIAPVSACVRVGQKMQARFHANFLLYERMRRSDAAPSPAPFAPTIQISPNSVTLFSTGESISLS